MKYNKHWDTTNLIKRWHQTCDVHSGAYWQELKSSLDPLVNPGDIAIINQETADKIRVPDIGTFRWDLEHLDFVPLSLL